MSDLDVKLTLKATDQGLSGVVRDAQKETVSLKESFDSADKSSKNLSKSQKSLTDSVTKNKDTAKKSANANEQLKKTLDETGESTAKAGNEQDKLADDLEKAAGKTKKADKESRSFNKALSNGAIKAKSWLRAIKGAGKSASSYSKKTGDASKGSRSFSKSLGGGAISAAKWTTALVGAAAVATAFAVAVNTQTIRETHQLAQTLDLSTQSLTEWEYAASQVNVSGEKVGDIFKDVSEKIGDFVTTGGGEAADLFENLNLKINDLVDLSPDEQLLAIGGALDEVGNRGQQIFFLESLASDAAYLLPLLENDAQLLKELQLEAQVLGVSITDIDAEKVALVGRSFDRVKGLVKGVTNDLTIELAPIIGFVSESLVDAAIDAGGFRGAIKTAVDVGVTGIGFVLDYVQQLRVWLKYSEKGWMLIGQAGTSAMASVADSTAKVINTVMYPFQQTLSWITEKFGDLLTLGAKVGGPFAERFGKAAKALEGMSKGITKYSVSAKDIVDLNRAMGESLVQTNNELSALLKSDAPSDVLKTKVEELRTEWDVLAKSQQKLSKDNKKFTGTIKSQADEVKKQNKAYKDLVKTLNEELALLNIGTERARKIEINQRKLSAKATKEQRDEIALLTGQIYDYEQAAQNAKDAAQPWQDAWSSATERIDSVFADVWGGAFDSFDNFTDSLIKGFKTTLAEMAHLAITKPIVLNITSAIGQSIGIPGTSTATAGISAASNIFSAGGISNLLGNGIGSTFTNFATSSFGQTLGLSAVETLPAGMIGPANIGLSNAGEFIGGGFSMGAGLGGMAANLLGLGSGNALGDAAASTVGAMIGNSLLPGIGGAIGSFLGTAVSGLFGGSNKPTEYMFAANSDEERFEGRNAVTLSNEFGESLFKVFRGREQDKEIVAAVTPLLQGISELESVIASTLTVDQVSTIKTDISAAGARSQDSTASIEEYTQERLNVILTQLDPAIQSLAEVSELTGTNALQFTASIVSINEQMQYGGPLVDMFNGSLEGMVGFLKATANENETLSQTFAQFQQTQAYYYQHFFTDTEKANRAIDEYRAVLSEFNTEFGTAIASKNDLRAYVEGLDLTSAAEQKAFQAAMLLAPQLVQLASAMDVAGVSATQTANSVYTGWIGERAQEIADNYQHELTLMTDIYNTRKKQLQSELNAASQLRQAVTNIRLSNISPLNADQRVDTAQAEFARLQVLIENGNLDNVNELGNAAQQYLNELSSARGADPFYVAEFDQVTKYLETLGVKLGGELDPLEAIKRLDQEMLNQQKTLVNNSRAELDLLAQQNAELTGLDQGLDALATLLGTLPDQLKTALSDLTGDKNNPVPTVTDYDFVNDLYKNGLGRDADTDGLAYWLEQLNNGTSRQSVKTAFFEAAAQNNEPNITPPTPQNNTLSNADFIAKLYTTGLNRQPDAAGVAYWLDELNSSGDRNAIKSAFFSGAEEKNEPNITYFATGGVVTRPQNFAFDREVSGNQGQVGEAGAEAIIPVGNGYIPAKFDSSLINEVKALRVQNAEQAAQLAKLNQNLAQLTKVTQQQGATAETQRDKQSRAIARAGRKAVAVTT